MRDPSVVLTAPQAEPLIPENLNAALHLSDLISIGWWANWILKSATEVDVYGEIGSWFAGDWAEVSRSGDALAKLGDFCTASCEALRGPSSPDGAARGAPRPRSTSNTSRARWTGSPPSLPGSVTTTSRPRPG